jgi:hypothetical protein
MKKAIIFALLILISMCMYSQKIVVGVLERAPTNNNRQDYYYTISKGNGTERELKQSMENDLKQNPQYNLMKDFAYAHVGNDGDYYVTIIKYNNKFGVGIGNNDSESLDRAIKMIKSLFYLNTTPNYETIYSADFSTDMNKLEDIFPNTVWKLTSEWIDENGTNRTGGCYIKFLDSEHSIFKMLDESSWRGGEFDWSISKNVLDVYPAGNYLIPNGFKGEIGDKLFGKTRSGTTGTLTFERIE